MMLTSSLPIVAGIQHFFGLLLFSSAVFLARGHSLLIMPITSFLRKRNFLQYAGSSSTSARVIVRSSNEFQLGSWRTMRTSMREGDLEEAKCEGDDEQCELEVINLADYPVYISYISPSGKLSSYRLVNDRSICDSSVTHRHLEYTYRGHSFIIIRAPEIFPQQLPEVSNNLFLAHVTPLRAKALHRIIIETAASLRSRVGPPVSVRYECIEQQKGEEEIIDTSSKPYIQLFIEGFEIRCEANVFNEEPLLEAALVTDLQVLNNLLPHRARELLQQSTPLYINKKIVYGKVSKPIVGGPCSFHPLGGAEWLRKHGLSVEKEGAIEIACAQNYLSARQQWGPGGILVHEFSHAYHNKFCEDGYDCKEIREAYSLAMKQKLYDCVPVHGPQGKKGPTKAYACANCMEFFAELSVAYLWTIDDSEYNKWYPHNRRQLMAHDPHSCEVIEKMWVQHEPRSC